MCQPPHDTMSHNRGGKSMRSHGANSPVKGKTSHHSKNRNKIHVNCDVL